jgi:hypothetical protein
MAGQPRYPGTGEDTDPDTGREPMTAGQRRTRVLVIVIVVAVLLAIVILHLTGTLGSRLNGG